MWSSAVIGRRFFGPMLISSFREKACLELENVGGSRLSPAVISVEPRLNLVYHVHRAPKDPVNIFQNVSFSYLVPLLILLVGKET